MTEPLAPATDAPALRDAYRLHHAPLFEHSAVMRALREVVETVASTTAPVLIRGETGVGKEVVARALHAASLRCDRPFIKVNCAALPPELLESELFGHEKGAFTGAYRRKPGKFELAKGGTILLDEIGELPLPLQAKLLHVLQDFQFSRVGGRELLQVKARTIAATNRDLKSALATGQFREDVYFRLNVIELHVPPLRERREEIRPLAALLLARAMTEYRRSATLTPDLLDVFEQYHWPGNVRQLDNVLRRLVLVGRPDEIVATLQRDLADRPTPADATTPAPPGDGDEPISSAPLARTPGPADPMGVTVTGLRDIARRAAHAAERKALVEVLGTVNWNRRQAARLLRVSYKTLLTKITEAGLDRRADAQS